MSIVSYMKPLEYTVESLLEDLGSDVVDTLQLTSHASVYSPPLSSAAHSPAAPQDTDTAPVTPFIRTTSNSNTPVWDENLRASLLRQGRHGLTRKEGRRKKKFKTPADLAWPVPYKDQPAADYAAKRIGFLVGMCYRIMKAQDLTPGATSPTERPSIPEDTREQLEEILMAVALELGDAYIVARLSNNGRWLTVTNKTTRKHAGIEKRSSYRTTNGEVTYEQLDKEVENAVTYAWDGWKDDYYTKRSEMGKKGGEISKRPPVYDYTLVRQWDGYSARAAADKLGWSEGTVKKARRATQGYGRPTPVSR
jgi:hypothetical protein